MPVIWNSRRQYGNLMSICHHFYSRTFTEDFQFRINYARDEFSTILGLLDRTVSTNEFQYYVRLLDLSSLLDTIITNTTGNEKCSLLLGRHHVPQRSAGMTSSLLMEVTGTETTDLIEAGQLTYFIAVNRLNGPYVYGGQEMLQNADDVSLALGRCPFTVHLLSHY